MVIRGSLVAVLGMLLFPLALTPSVTADDAAHTTYLTFSRPVRLPGVSLAAGTYIFERASPFSGDLNMVRVISRDRRIWYYTGFTVLVDRPRDVGPKTMVSMGESVAGQPPPINTWWLMNEPVGHAFIYH
jgi:hypothetical protein